jgi:regulator of protease activity HflC (stomatin/prohibitin superfamily)
VLRDILGHGELDDLLTKTSDITKQIQQEIDQMTDPWGIKVSAVVISDVVLPIEMERAIAKQAEAERERRSRIIVADGEYMAAQKMTEAAEIYAKNPMSIKLREMQMLSEISREKNLIVVTSSTDIKDASNVAALTRAMKESEKDAKTE